jgi:hypothetical protein
MLTVQPSITLVPDKSQRRCTAHGSTKEQFCSKGIPKIKRKNSSSSQVLTETLSSGIAWARREQQNQTFQPQANSQEGINEADN